MTEPRGNHLWECRRCNSRIVPSRAPRSPTLYFRCELCGITTSNADSAAFRAAIRSSIAAKDEVAASEAELSEWRRRLERFNARADETDPFARLQLSPNASLAEARDRFHELALAHHPDRGGESEALVEIIEAYDRIRDRFSQSAARPPAVKPRPAPLPASEKPILPRRRPESWSRWAPTQPRLPSIDMTKRGR